MKFYRLLSKGVPGKNFAGTCKKVLPPNICKKISKQIPETGEITSFSLEKEDNDRIVKIIEKRKSITQHFSSLSVGTPNYLPFSFLQRALRCSAAVCLIGQKYQIKEIIKLIENTSTKDFPSILHVISDKLNLRDKFWEGYDTVSEAIKNENFQNQLRNKEENTVLVPIGTGFLVGRNYLLTNNHVLPDEEVAKSCIVQFKYEKDEFGRDRKPIVEYYLDISFFKTSPESELDYTLVKLHPFSFAISTELANINDEDIEEQKENNRKKFNLAFEEAGDNFGWLPMLKDDDLISPALNLKKTQDLEILKYLPEDLQASAKLFDGFVGESVNIIQHPRGRQKEVVISDNKVQSIYEKVIEYTADADFGSSGSPVFNNRWQLVALHHAMLVKYDDAETSSEQNVIVRGNLGVRIHQIVAHLEKQEGTEDFLRDFVNKPQGKKRKIFILAGRKRTRFKGDEREEEAKLTKYIGKKVEELLNKSSQELKDLLNESSSENQFIPEDLDYEFQPEYVPKDNKEELENAINWIKQKTDSQVMENNYQLGDVAIEIVTNYYYQNTNNNEEDPKTEQVGGATVYYVNLPNFKGERKIHAETLLISILNNVLVDNKPALPNRGAQPDTAVRNDGLRFCREVIIPSLVLYVGYWTNTKERQLMKEKKDEIAKGIVKGIVLWSNSIFPLIK